MNAGWTIMKMPWLLAAGALFLAGCSDTGTDPKAKPMTNVQVSFATQAAGTPAVRMQGAPAALLDDTLTAGSDTIIVTSAELVLRKIELRRAGVVSCDSTAGSDSCEEFDAGPVLIGLPLTGSLSTPFAVDVPADTYSDVEFEIHKVSNSDPEDAAFLAAHPTFAGTSIRVTGTFNGQMFLYESDLNVTQELVLVPPLVVDATTTATNITVFVDLDGWFRDAAGGLVDPAQGNKGGAFENLIRDNIKNSIEAFEDADRDGRR